MEDSAVSRYSFSEFSTSTSQAFFVSGKGKRMKEFNSNLPIQQDSKNPPDTLSRSLKIRCIASKLIRYAVYPPATKNDF